MNKFMFFFALLGCETIDAAKAKLYSPSKEALKEAVIRVTDESHVWEFKGIVPGTFTSLFMASSRKCLLSQTTFQS